MIIDNRRFSVGTHHKTDRYQRVPLFSGIMECSTPLPITIVTGGQVDADAFWNFLASSNIDDDEWCCIDLTKTLVKDPGTKVGHKQGHEFQQTQIAVFGQTGFPATVIDIMSRSLYRNTLVRNFFVHCRSGWHRASVVGRCLRNGHTVIATEGQGRMFNCQVFSLNDAYGHHDRDYRMEIAIRWSSKPWALIEGGSLNRDQHYAYEACMSDEYSVDGFNKF